MGDAHVARIERTELILGPPPAPPPSSAPASSPSPTSTSPPPFPTVEVVEVVPGPINKGGRPPKDPAQWGAPYLRWVRKTGNLYRSARRVGVSPTTVMRYRKRNPAYGRAIGRALLEYGASLEEGLGRQAKRGNVIAAIARLKALGERFAQRYSERAVDARVMNLTINQTAIVSDAQGLALLQAMAEHLTPATHALIAPPVDVNANVVASANAPPHTVQRLGSPPTSRLRP